MRLLSGGIYRHISSPVRDRESHWLPSWGCHMLLLHFLLAVVELPNCTNYIIALIQASEIIKSLQVLLLGL